MNEMTPGQDPNQHGEIDAANQLIQATKQAHEAGLNDAVLKGIGSHVRVTEQGANGRHGVDFSEGYQGGHHVTLTDGNFIEKGDDKKTQAVYKYEGQLYDDMVDENGNEQVSDNRTITSRGEFQGGDRQEPVEVKRKTINGKTGETEVGVIKQLTGERAEKARAIMNKRAARTIMNKTVEVSQDKIAS